MPNIYTDRKGVKYTNTTVLVPLEQKRYAEEHGMSLSHVLRRAMSEKMAIGVES